MNVDNASRRFLYIQADDTTEFDRVVAGWLELAEEHEPGTPKALLEGDFLAFLPDDTCFKEVSYKREHYAVEHALTAWRRSVGRHVARLSDESFVLDDGRHFDLNEVRFVSLE